MNDKQKRALGIGAIGIVGVLAYRHLHSGSRPVTNFGTPTNGLAQASSPVGSTMPYTPQSPVVVPAGESIYDPNAEALINTPTAIPPQATTKAAPAYVVNVIEPKHVAVKKNRRRPGKRAHGKGASNALAKGRHQTKPSTHHVKAKVKR